MIVRISLPTPFRTIIKIIFGRDSAWYALHLLNTFQYIIAPIASESIFTSSKNPQTFLRSLQIYKVAPWVFISSRCSPKRTTNGASTPGCNARTTSGRCCPDSGRQSSFSARTCLWNRSTARSRRENPKATRLKPLIDI